MHARFGTEFPIRFDFLDTMGGGNSLQLYIQDRFGMNYTQDESYYLLDAAEEGRVYLGLREGIDKRAMVQDLRVAQAGGAAFPVEVYMNKWPRPLCGGECSRCYAWWRLCRRRRRASDTSFVPASSLV